TGIIVSSAGRGAKPSYGLIAVFMAILSVSRRWRTRCMALYELRTYQLYVGKMAEAVRLYQEFGYPAIKKGGHEKHLVGYFQGDTGMINQLVHLWKFEDDADRRARWSALFANTDFTEGFAA